MTTGYYIDFEQFSLEKLKKAIESAQLLPSQNILKENLEERFAQLAALGISSLADLQKQLKTKTAVNKFAESCGIPIDYLTILRREAFSYQPKPILLKDFPGVDPAAVNKLAAAGIKNTLQLFPLVLTPADRQTLSAEHDIPAEALLDLTHLADMARLKWVGPKFARLLVETPYNTVETLQTADPAELYETLIRVNETKDIYRGGLGLEDMRLWLLYAIPDVPCVIRYA